MPPKRKQNVTKKEEELKEKKKTKIEKDTKSDTNGSEEIIPNKRPQRAAKTIAATKLLLADNDSENGSKKKRAKTTKSEPKKQTVKKEAKKPEDKIEVPPKATKAPTKKKAATTTEVPKKPSNDLENIDYNCTLLNKEGDDWNFKIASWNVNGIRAWLTKGNLEYMKHEEPDIFCIQETKCSLEKLPDDVKNVEKYHSYWSSAEKDGYSGVGLYTKIMPIDVTYGINDPEHGTEGRIITAEFKRFFVICVYVPNAGRGLVTMPKRLSWNEAFRKYLKKLDEKKPVIICGDMNVAHQEIDVYNEEAKYFRLEFTCFSQYVTVVIFSELDRTKSICVQCSATLRCGPNNTQDVTVFSTTVGRHIHLHTVHSVYKRVQLISELSLILDLKNPKTNKKTAGFTQEERDGMTTFLGDGYIDTFRNLYPDKENAYTFWSSMSNARAKNVGWRIDYFLVSERFMPKICDNIIRSEVYGSDHCPLVLYFHNK